MTHPATCLMLALTLMVAAASACADEYMAGAEGRVPRATGSPADADCAGGAPGSARSLRVEPMPAPGATTGSARESASRVDLPVAASNDASESGGGSSGSAEPAVAPRPRSGLRWQSVLPGSIK